MPDAAAVFHPPVKRSIAIAGHRTSISLEPIFWDALRSAAKRQGMSVSALVAEIDAERIAVRTPTGLGTALRCWLLAREMERASLADVYATY